MKKSSKILLAAATIWPIFYMLLFMGFILLSFLSSDNGPGSLFAIIIPLHLLTMLLIMGLTVFYIVNVFRNDLVKKDMKVLWAVVIFMGSLVAMPIYWYLYIWRAAPVLGSTGQSQLGVGSQSSWKRPATAATPEAAYVPPSQPPDWR